MNKKLNDENYEIDPLDATAVELTSAEICKYSVKFEIVCYVMITHLSLPLKLCDEKTYVRFCNSDCKQIPSHSFIPHYEVHQWLTMFLFLLRGLYQRNDHFAECRREAKQGEDLVGFEAYNNHAQCDSWLQNVYLLLCGFPPHNSQVIRGELDSLSKRF